MAVLTASVPASSRTQTSLSRPTGDAKYHAPGYLDIVRVEVTDGTDVRFSDERGGAVSRGPASAAGYKARLVGLGPQHGPDNVPCGYPVPAGQGAARRVPRLCGLGWQRVLGRHDRPETFADWRGSGRHGTSFHQLRQGFASTWEPVCSVVRRAFLGRRRISTGRPARRDRWDQIRGCP